MNTNDDMEQTINSNQMDYFENIRANATSFERVGNLDIVTDENDGSQLGFCHLVHMTPLTWFTTDGERKPFLTWQSAEQVAAMYIALRQLNTGDGSVVKEAEGLNKRCNIRFTAELIDTELTEVAAVNKALEIVKRVPGKDRLPCAFLGASRSAVSMPTSIITGILGYPQFSSISTSTALNDKSQYKLFGRTIPSDDGTSIPAIDYFRNQLNVKHLCVLYANDSYGSEYARSLQKAGAIMAPDMKIVPVEIPAIAAYQEDFEVAVSIMKATQFRYIFAIVFGETQYNELMTEAYEQGIAGPGYTWVFADATAPEVVTDQQFVPGSPLHVASLGISVLKAEGGIPGMPGYDRFVKAYQALSDEDVAYIDSQIPQYQDDPDYEYTSVGVQLKDRLPSATVSFIYDATMALGLAACDVSMESGSSSMGNATSIAWEGGGETHFQAVMDAEPFEAASGQIVFLPDTGGRDPNSALFQLTNLVPNEELDPETGKVTFRAVSSELFQNGVWETVTPHVFSDGSTVAPSDLPDLRTDFMYIGTGLRVGGLILSLIGMGMAIGFSRWTFKNRKGKVVQVSQPIFLHIICFGNFLMASSIIPLSFDDEVISAKACSVTCMTTYWLFWVGFAVAFSALFSKTWRLNQLFYNQDMRRKTVSVSEVVKPMFILVLTNVLILAIWTAISPLEWERIVFQFDGFGRAVASQGNCTSKLNLLFQILMAVVNATALFIALYQVWRARHISNEFGETKYIIAAISGMLLVSFVGVPVMIIASDNPRANFFVLSCVIFVICTLFLLFIFVPKLQFHNQIVEGKKSMKQVVRRFSIQSANLNNSRAGSEFMYEESLNDTGGNPNNTWAANNRSFSSRSDSGYDASSSFKPCRMFDALDAVEAAPGGDLNSSFSGDDAVTSSSHSLRDSKKKRSLIDSEIRLDKGSQTDKSKPVNSITRSSERSSLSKSRSSAEFEENEKNKGERINDDNLGTDEDNIQSYDNPVVQQS